MDKKTLLKTYAAAGLHIFPCRERGKEPLTADGFKSASADWQQIERWYNANPNCNWAVSTGPSNLLAVDYDPAHGGTIAALKAITGPLPATWQQATGSDGVHQFFKRPSNLTISQRNGVYPGIDIRGTSGYIMIEPSIHPNGKPYRWTNAPWESGLSEAPAKLIEALTKVTAKSAIATAERNNDGEFFFSDGARFSNFQSLAGKLRSLGFGREALYESLMSVYKYQAEHSSDFPQKIQDVTDWLCQLPAQRSNDVVIVEDPKGERYKIPIYKVSAALARGWKKL